MINGILTTCLIFAAIHNVSGDVTLFAMKLDTFNENDSIPDNNTT